MISSADLFTFTLLATGVLYACLLAYFKKFTSAHRLELRAYPLDHYTVAYILNRIQNRSDRCRGKAGCLVLDRHRQSDGDLHLSRDRTFASRSTKKSAIGA